MNLFYVPYSIALEGELSGWPIMFDVIIWLFYIADSIMRSHVATEFTKGGEIITSKQKIIKAYLDQRFLLDLIAILPFDYFAMPFGISLQVRAFLRLTRFAKLYRIAEMISQIKQRSKISIPLFTIFLLSLLFVLLSHLMACIYIFIGKREVYQQSRFDGQSMFEDLLNRNFIVEEPVSNMPLF